MKSKFLLKEASMEMLATVATAMGFFLTSVVVSILLHLDLLTCLYLCSQLGLVHTSQNVRSNYSFLRIITSVNFHGVSAPTISVSCWLLTGTMLLMAAIVCISPSSLCLYQSFCAALKAHCPTKVNGTFPWILTLKKTTSQHISSKGLNRMWVAYFLEMHINISLITSHNAMIQKLVSYAVSR